MATKTSIRALAADTATAADITDATGADKIIAPATTTADADAATSTAAATEAILAQRIRKAVQLRAMLEAPGGASLTALMAATGWQAHTVRAALSGLRKGGTELAREKRDGNTVYRIVSLGAKNEPAAPEVAGSQPTVPDGATTEIGVSA